MKKAIAQYNKAKKDRLNVDKRLLKSHHAVIAAIKVAVKRFKEKIKIQKVIDTSSNYYKGTANPLSYSTDLVIPTTSTSGEVRVEELGGNVDIKNIVDNKGYC